MERQETLPKEKILEYLPLVKRVVSRIFPKIPSQVFDFEDLVGYGIVGLMEAISTFNSHKGVKLSTYAFYRIRGAILDALRSLDWVPRSMRDKIHRLEEVTEELKLSLGREPTEDELADKLNISREELETLFMEVYQSQIVSLEDGLHNYLANKTDNFMNLNEFEVTDLKDALIKAIDQLPSKEKLVLTLYYYEELNLKEIGKVLDISESRVSQIMSKAIGELKNRLDFLNKEIV
ncbi:MAG: FliA/WhiG family RNA polymerase sigma factor [Candidatus Omnitrophica bacterium]|nr:FliA/WhiG family RNA polymerase sigma factor [Candidatus Omnitrophota bacterium]MCM8826408.1 FliA/WhiG family RNA polymerase sigma factor [Candidatus Omnitrophota bacterium]